MSKVHVTQIWYSAAIPGFSTKKTYQLQVSDTEGYVTYTGDDVDSLIFLMSDQALEDEYIRRCSPLAKTMKENE